MNNDDARDYVKYPNSNVTADPTVTVQDDEELRKSTSFQAVNQTETQVNDWIAVRSGSPTASLQHGCGNWITPTYSSTANAVYVADTASASTAVPNSMTTLAISF